MAGLFFSVAGVSVCGVVAVPVSSDPACMRKQDIRGKEKALRPCRGKTYDIDNMRQALLC